MFCVGREVMGATVIKFTMCSYRAVHNGHGRRTIELIRIVKLSGSGFCRTVAISRTF